ncbi:hypothetical protein KUTeg_019703 [Tegillarca granosa]|uniref:UBC core domain-containing protein n=1 Tax=Tegillarca granosa TaxID=220873 RepID=A0ABQ9EDD1_TEGGR|nr:hypothetical protein KUTeg_019703 [Tegillarca granosa]
MKSKYNMEFKQHVDAAKRWTEESETRFEVSSADESEGRIYFQIKEGPSFYISAEDDGDEKKWMVWSNDEKVLPKLESFQEFTDREKPLDDLLNRISKALSPKCYEKKTKMGSDDDIDEEFEDDDDFANYYNDEDIDAQEPKDKEELSEEEELAENFFDGQPNNPAVQRLFSDMKNMTKSKDKFGIDAVPRGDNLFVWDVKLKNFPPESRLSKDLQKFAEKYKKEPAIVMEMQFPTDYPMSPPFVRVVYPRFQFLTGHITIGGSICMELLTKSGWRPTNDIEIFTKHCKVESVCPVTTVEKSILICVRSEIMSDPKACLDSAKGDQKYSEEEARAAFRRMVQRYNWDK